MLYSLQISQKSQRIHQILIKNRIETHCRDLRLQHTTFLLLKSSSDAWLSDMPREWAQDIDNFGGTCSPMIQWSLLVLTNNGETEASIDTDESLNKS